MIRYDLRCDGGHPFDGWFRDSAAYDSQARHGLVACAVCGSTRIEKQVMAPAIPAKAKRRDAPAPTIAAGPVDPKVAALHQMMRRVRAAVEANSEYVGDRFAEEARRIHYEEAERRGIHGEATVADARELVEEGIEIHPLPSLPDDAN
jgi:hypothetical protein